jgi:hypothetical protein
LGEAIGLARGNLGRFRNLNRSACSERGACVGHPSRGVIARRKGRRAPLSRGHGATHSPIRQRSVAAQTTPQAPQFIGSRITGAQVPSQSTVLPAQSHTDASQVPTPHALSHSPQWRGSRVRSAQRLPHCERVSGHTHAPATQREPPVQVMPQPPQLVGDVCRSTHEPAQLVVPSGHSALQLPAAHASVAAHAVVHAPQ